VSGILYLRGARIKRKFVTPHKRFKPIQCTISNGMNNFLGQENVTIHPQASMRAKGWRGEKTNRMWVVEKPAGEEPSGQRFSTWVVRHLSWRCSRGRHPVEETGDIFIVLSAGTTGMRTGCRTPEDIRQDVAPQAHPPSLLRRGQEIPRTVSRQAHVQPSDNTNACILNRR
jgi:hypothetical protein